jgi:DNA-binding transcriptional LysR family regulator
MTTAATPLPLNLDDLALFLRIVELGSLSAAARERNVPASQVTRALARLERACGTRLLHRSTHALGLTDAGQATVQHARAMLQAADELHGALGSGRGGVQGRVKLAVSAVMAQAIVVPSLPELYERHPDLQLDIAAADHVVDLAREGIDIALRTGEPGSDEFVARRMGLLRRALYASPAYVQRHGLPQRPEDLATHRLLTNTATPTLNRWQFASANGTDGAARQAWEARGHTRTDNTAVVVSLAIAGIGIARIATRWARPLVAAGSLVEVLPGQLDGGAVPIHAVMLQGRQRLPKVRAVLDHLARWIGRD